MIMKFRDQIILISIFLVFCLVFPNSSIAGIEFLNHPFLDKNLPILAGWYYRDGKIHRAVDYDCSQGERIYAASNGVAMTSKQPRTELKKVVYGNFVIINHQNGYFTLYAHLDSVNSEIREYPADQRGNKNYSEWTKIKKGEFIGTCGNSGCEDTVTHLHFELSTGYAVGKTDPYDIYKTAPYYPPTGSRYTGVGQNHFWLPEALAIILNLPSEKEELSIVEKPLPEEKSIWQKIKDIPQNISESVSNFFEEKKEQVENVGGKTTLILK